MIRALTLSMAAATLAGSPAVAQRADWRPGPTMRSAAPDRCTPGADIAAARRKAPPSMKLGDQPPANQFYAIYNLVDRCPQPVVVRKGIGANPEKAEPVLHAPPRATKAN